MDIAEARHKIADNLTSNGIDDGALEAGFILCHVLGLTNTALHVQPDLALTEEQMNRLDEVLRRRLKREPLAYILGECEFYGLSFNVDHRVLIPRPETEMLVEKAMEKARLFATRHGRMPLIADVGTGSGCIAITLALNLPGSHIYATDVSASALEVTAVNCLRHCVNQQIELVHCSLLDGVSVPVDMLTANLPYIETSELSALPQEVSRFEPRTALDGGVSGLQQISSLLLQAQNKLSAHGLVILEVGHLQASRVASIARSLFPERTISCSLDYSGIKRVVCIE